MHPFHLFALQLADHLPGTWTALYRQYTCAADQFADTCRVWTPLDARPAIAFRRLGTTLRRDDGLELYLVEHRRGRS